MAEKDSFSEIGEIPHPKIRVILRIKERYFYCCITNRVNSDVLRENPALHTTKQEVQEHGYGIPAIKKIAELYQGMTGFSVQRGEFVASVMLLCPEAPGAFSRAAQASS